MAAECVRYNALSMVTPRIVPRAEHTLSRRDIDPDALKVLNRLRQFDHIAYLVGGSVRDLLLGRRPKDFDIGTSAHPYEVKRLFRNCWVVGRRFRLAHVKFGVKTIEVATFRRQVSEDELDAIAQEHAQAEAEQADAHDSGGVDEPHDAEVGRTDAPPEVSRRRGGDRRGHHDHEHLVHRDNTFGTPEEDAFRRDFTVNALFYDIATLSVIDYVGGLDDLHARVIRCIGDPDVRFREDPVRMLRAIVLAARLDFGIDPPVVDAIRRLAPEIARAAPARLIEEIYKILRSGSAERAFRELAEVGLLTHMAPELLQIDDEGLWEFLGGLDEYRQRFDSTPETLTNPVLLGSLLVPRGFTGRRPFRLERSDRDIEAETAGERRRREREEWRDPRATLGVLPVARRDVERLRQILGMQRRMLDMESSPRTKRGLLGRGPFAEALTWLEIHGHAPEIVEHWRGFIEAVGVAPVPESVEVAADLGPRRRRRRGRRRRRPEG
jgi:poly(A) polymerase